MGSHFVIISLIALLIIMGAIFMFAAHNAHKRERAYKSALENNQKKLDQQSSRVGILTRALPSIQGLLIDVKNPDVWQTPVLDEVRALILADGASYWRYHEKDGEIEMIIARGLESTVKETRVKTDPHSNAPLLQAVRTRVGVLHFSDEIASEPKSVMAMPLVVGDSLWGVFRLIRNGEERISTREHDLVAMFIKQVGLGLENREMVNNREKFYLELVQTLAEIMDARDSGVPGQSKKLRYLARSMAKELEMPEQFTYYLEYAALMHDIGKIAIDDQVLKKPGKLTEQEFALVKQHPEIGYKILSPVTMLAPVAPMVLYHQEWFNGKGYPEGLSGEEIPLGARIVAVLDAWNAMTSIRPWRPAMTDEASMQEIKKGAGTQFDPRVVDAFVTVVEKSKFLTY